MAQQPISLHRSELVKVGIIQSSYIPWRGYFDFIDSVDRFIVHDDIQYTKGDWRNRNKIKTSNGLKWVSVPVRYGRTSQLIYKTQINHDVNWRDKHLKSFNGNYQKATYYADAYDILFEGLATKWKTISELNVVLTKLICRYLKISTTIQLSTKYAVGGTKTERLINLLKKCGATAYLSGPTASGYLDENLFRKNEIGLEYKTYEYKPYPQLWGGFEGAVTILDLIANCGPNAKSYLKSLAPNKIVVE